ncbi:MAG: GNAT family N-acetyltransferase [Clostridiales bacterium]|nr:GNAT family N-acetyltransferase [Clostridiales bacterium]
MITVKEVKTNKELKEFVKFPNTLYEDNPCYVPFLISDEIGNLRKDKNPAFAFCDAKYFMAYKDGKPAGRVAAILSKESNKKWGTKRLRFSRIDFIDDQEVSGALLKAVEDWAKELGMEEVHGPIGFTDMDQEGMLIEGFDREDMFITIYNAPYYKEHMAAHGYEKDVDWVEYRITIPKEKDNKIDRLAQMVIKRNNLKVFQPKSMKDIRPVIKPVFKLLNEAYTHLYGTVELTPELINKYYSQFVTMVNPKYISGVYDQEDNLLAIGIVIPSMGAAVKKSKGKLFPLGWARVLKATRQKNGVLDLLLVAVDPRYQGKGLNAILMNQMIKAAIEDGMTYAETGPELETNEKVQALWRFFETEQHRRRRCWIKKI